jgi:acyl-CoA reductase-like NAD-dependent aldehyde dehydrogenase
MDLKGPRSYCANLGDLELKIDEANGLYRWSVINSKTGEQLARGEVAGLEDAMVAAAQAAQAEWGVVRWRRLGAEEEDE